MNRLVNNSSIVKVVSLLVMCFFAFQGTSQDMGLRTACERSSGGNDLNKLAVPIINNSILGQEAQDYSVIREAIEIAVKALGYEKGAGIDLEKIVRKAKENTRIRATHFKGFQFFVHTPELKENLIMCRFSAQGNKKQRTYWVSIDVDSNGELITKVENTHPAGFICSKNGNEARMELGSMRVVNEDRAKLHKKEVKNKNEIIKNIQELLPKAREIFSKPGNPYEKERFDKILAAIGTADERIERIFKEGNIFSFAPIIKGKHDYAIAYGDENEIGLAEDLWGFELPFLAELIVHEALCFELGHDDALRAQRVIFDDINYVDDPESRNQKKNLLGERLRSFIDNKSASALGIENASVEAKIAMLKEKNILSFMMDHSDGNNSGLDYEICNMLEKRLPIIFYGDYSAICEIPEVRFSLMAKYMDDKEERMMVLLDREEGLVGGVNVPEQLNNVIKKALAKNKKPVMIRLDKIIPIFKYVKNELPEGESFLENMIKNVKPLLSYEAVSKVWNKLAGNKIHINDLEREIDAMVNKRVDERIQGREMERNEVRIIEEEVKNDPDIAEKQEELNTLHYEEYENENQEHFISKIMSLIDRDTKLKYLRRYILENDMVQEHYILMEIIIGKSSYHFNNETFTAYLWDLYMDPSNTATENEKFKKVLLTNSSRSYDSEDTLYRISAIFGEGKLNSTQKAIEILLSLELGGTTLDKLFNILGSVKVKKDLVTEYAFMMSFLYDMKNENMDHARYAIYQKNSPVIDSMTPEAGSIYYYLLKIEEARRRGGALKEDAARRVANAAAYMDGGGYNNWYTSLRRFVHDRPGKHLLPYTRNILLFWKDGDISRFSGYDLENTQNMEMSLGEKYLLSMRELLNTLVDKLNERGHKISNEADKFVEDILTVDMDECLTIVEDMGSEETKYKTEKLFGMIRMYYSLVEQYGTVQAKVIPIVKGAQLNLKQQEFMEKEHKLLCDAIDLGEPTRILINLADCRLKLKEYLMTYKEDDQNSLSDDITRDKLMEMDYNMHLMGRDAMAEAMKTFDKCRTLDDIKALVPVLSAMGRFINSSGLGGIEFEHHLKELYNGDITYSQLHDLVRALRTEAHKIQRKINEDIRYITSRSLPGKDYNYLKDEWQKISRPEKRTVKTSWGEQDAHSINTEEAERIAANIIDTIVQDSAIPIFDSALIGIEEILEKELTAENDMPLKPNKSIKIKNLTDNFFRFGQTDVIPRDELLSKWSKKGLNLVKMTQMGLPVPPGVILSAELLKQPEIFKSEAFREQVKKEIDLLRQESKYPDLKLLLYARSGSAFTLPGLLATIPNIGMNDFEAEDLAKTSKDVWFAYDTYAEFLRSYAINVFGIPSEHFDKVVNIYDKDSLSAEQMKDVCEKYKNIIKTYGKGAVIPENMIDQVMLAIDAVYESWGSSEAQEYRARHRISPEWGSVVILEKGVFGNLNTTEDGRISGTGAAALRLLPDGREVIQGKFRFRSIGEQLMSRAEQNYILMSNSEKQFDDEQTLEELEPELYEQLLMVAHKIKEGFVNRPHFEFTIELGKIWITQTNDDIERDEHPEFYDSDELSPIGRGHGVSGGAFRGWVANDMDIARILLEKYKTEQPKDIDGVILFLDRVNQEMINKIPKGVHIVAHALSVYAETLAQQEGITAVYGVVGMEKPDEEKNWFIGETEMLNGMTISIDGHENGLLYHNSGKIFLGSIPVVKKTQDKTEVERRSERALSAVSRLRDQELWEEAMRKKRSGLTSFEREVLEIFEEYGRGEKERKDITRYLQNYRAILDKVARVSEGIDESLIGNDLKEEMIKKLVSLGLSFDNFVALEKHCFPLSEMNRKIIDSITVRLLREPCAPEITETATMETALGEEITLERTGENLFDLPEKKIVCKRPEKAIKLISFEIDEVLEQWMQNFNHDEIVKLFKALKERGLEVVVSSMNPQVESIMEAIFSIKPELRKYIDEWHYDNDRPDLERYVKKKGYDRKEIMHVGNYLYGLFSSDIRHSATSELHERGFVTILVGSNKKYSMNANEIFEKRVDGYIPRLTNHKDLLSLIDRWIKVEIGKTSISQSNLNDAADTGLMIPTNIHDGRYTLLVDHTLYENNKEYEADKWGNDQTAGFGDRFDLEIADTGNIDNLLAHIKAIRNKENKMNTDSDEKIFERIIVKVPSGFKKKDAERLKAEAPGTRILKVDTDEMKMIDNDDERKKLRFDLYAMMLSARRITDKDIEERNAVYRTLSFFLNTHYGDGEKDISKELIQAISSNNLKKVLNYSLSFRPAGKWSIPQYHTIAATLMSA
ncbi:MAG: hypothetical protein HQL29_01510 [Candidatus Omnitrophica bacterium]|nr:hypothetical protein [Candidatus Omnitrophota bacterium]